MQQTKYITQFLHKKWPNNRVQVNKDLTQVMLDSVAYGAPRRNSIFWYSQQLVLRLT